MNDTGAVVSMLVYELFSTPWRRVVRLTGLLAFLLEAGIHGKKRFYGVADASPLQLRR